MNKTQKLLNIRKMINVYNGSVNVSMPQSDHTNVQNTEGGVTISYFSVSYHNGDISLHRTKALKEESLRIIDMVYTQLFERLMYKKDRELTLKESDDRRLKLKKELIYELDLEDVD